MTQLLPSLIPPFRFAMVEENLFRGGYPKPRNMRFLKRLHLKTILSLIPEKLKPEVQDFCNQQHIQMLHIKVDKMKEDNIPLSYNKTLMALQIIVDPSNHPLYIHCLDGADVTGLVIACLRKLQMWSTSSALGEFSRYLHTNVIASEEFEFVENFRNFEVTIPPSIPTWLWGGQVSFRKHCCLRLKFLNPDMMTEEERELKDKKEKQEDYYKWRKTNLLDNLLDTSATNPHGVMRHWSGNHFSPATGAMASQNTALGSPQPLSAAGSDDSHFVPSSKTGLGVFSTEDGQEGRESVGEESPAKDRYFVDVDVDVDGVMMDGLDQVRYYNGTSSYFDNDEFGIRQHYDGDEDADGLMVDEENDEVEPISRTLEALALEGLGD